MASSPALDVRWRSGPGTPALCERLHACLDDFAPLAVQDHETLEGWRIFFTTSSQRDQAANAILRAFSEQLDEIRAVDVADDDWARRSQAGLRAIQVGRIVVAPPWDVIPGSRIADPRSLPTITIVIDPSTAFGTGHHETTRLCLGILQALDVTGRRVIDVGTGSGVLAIGAAKLGAQSVLAIDNDPDALENARDNVRRNDCAGVIEIEDCDLDRLATEPADVVIANLTGAVLARYAARVTDLLNPGGALIVSGFEADEQSSIADIFPGLAVADRAVEAAWAALVLRRLS